MKRRAYILAMALAGLAIEAEKDGRAITSDDVDACHALAESVDDVDLPSEPA